MDKTWTKKTGASPEELAKLVEEFPEGIPKLYLEYLKESNGGEGNYPYFLPWIRLWPTDQILVENIDYQLPEYAPGYIAIGSCCAEEELVLLRKVMDVDSPVYAVNAVSVGDEDDNILLAESIKTFLENLGNELKSNDS